MKVATKKRKSGFYIEITCPGCGGGLELDDDFFVLECNHCGSVHRVVRPETPAAYLTPARVDRRQARFKIDRYLKKRSLPLTGSGMHLKCLYYPYWKIDAILFRVRNKVIEQVLVEGDQYQSEVKVSKNRTEISLSPYTTTTAAGNCLDGVPVSLGMRTEYVKLLPYSTENIDDDFDSLPVVTTWDDVRKDLLLNVSRIAEIDAGSSGPNQTKLFHPKAALVYFPFLIFESYHGGDFNRYVVDGVSGRMLGHVTEMSDESRGQKGDAALLELGALTVEHHRCSNCGLDLPPEQSFIYICRNCHWLTVLGDTGNAVSEIFLAGEIARPGDRMCPFWSFQLPEDTAPRIKRMFKGIYDSDRLAIPAFKMANFEAMSNLSRRVSAAMPQMALSELESLDNRFAAVSVSLDEALTLAEVIIYRQNFSGPTGIDSADRPLQVKDIQMVYVPFRRENYFMVDSNLNAITFAKTLAP
ncbi:MAG: hypothetical protein JSW34_07425 [Candidatus Zixiibacteriota bacterium]|nr:MAG: hypothetical protein JSW34_07425 [candidate division Zixibacteria bacterium]